MKYSKSALAAISVLSVGYGELKGGLSAAEGELLSDRQNDALDQPEVMMASGCMQLSIEPPKEKGEKRKEPV